MTGYVEEPFDIFAVTAPPVRREPTAKDLDDATNRVTWMAYRSTRRVHCYTCLEMILDGREVTPERASWSRTQNGEQRLLCQEHARALRDQESRP